MLKKLSLRSDELVESVAAGWLSEVAYGIFDQLEVLDKCIWNFLPLVCIVVLSDDSQKRGKY